MTSWPPTRTLRRATPSDRSGQGPWPMASPQAAEAAGARLERPAVTPATDDELQRIHPAWYVALAGRGGVTWWRLDRCRYVPLAGVDAGVPPGCRRHAGRRAGRSSGRGRGRLRRGAAAGPPCLRGADAWLLPAEQRGHRRGRAAGRRTGPADRDRRLGRAPRRRHAGHLRCRCGPLLRLHPPVALLPGDRQRGGAGLRPGHRHQAQRPPAGGEWRPRLHRGLDGPAAAGHRVLRTGGDPGLGRLRRPSATIRWPCSR